MQEFITVQKIPIMWEALPTIVLKNYRDSSEINPYTQCRICAVKNDLYIRLFSFETTPTDDSQIILYLSQNGAVAEFLLTPKGLLVRKITANGVVLSVENISATEIGGENNQGIFWGSEFSVPQQIIQDIFGLKKLDRGVIFKGEVVKKQGGDKPHYGTLFAKDDKNFFETNSFDGEFVVTGY